MSTFPKTVTRDQMKAAAEALGLPAADVAWFSADARRGVTVTYYVRDERGIKVDSNGNAMSCIIDIPIGPAVP